MWPQTRARPIELGITQEELALRSGLHQRWISNVENGHRNPSYGSLRRLAAGLEMPTSGLIEMAERSQAGSGRVGDRGRSSRQPRSRSVAAERSVPPRTLVGMDDVEGRVGDALTLWRTGRLHGAFLLAVVAVVARARQDFPGPMGEGASFRRYIESKFAMRLSVEYRGTLWPIEDIFYKWFRCEIVHTGGLPVDIGFAENVEPGELSIRAGGAPDYQLLLSPARFDQLIAWARA